MSLPDIDTIEKLVNRVIQIAGDSRKEIDRCCWMVVHEHYHGVMPSEYDIREINEDLYLAILKRVRELH
tara:strand:+ start:1856 stop:2062 length:207 start_codon:yes stop_codon:yes gene_type:complete